MDGYLIPKQIGVLLAPIKEHRVGRDGKGYSHVEAYELRAHLNRLFGFCRWSADVLSQELVFEDGKQDGARTKWTVCYHTVLRLTVNAPDGTLLATYTEGAMGDAQNQPSRADAHDLAAKTSASQAFKRCCMNLGDSFGLSLYRGGSMEPLVKVTLVNGEGGAAGKHDGDLQDAAPTTYRAPESQPASRGVSDSTAPAPRGCGCDPHQHEDGYTDPACEVHGRLAQVVSETPSTALGKAVQESVLTAAEDAGLMDEPPDSFAPSAIPTKDDYADRILKATERGEVIPVMREFEMAKLGGAEVGDENGQPTTLRDLANTRMKALA